MNWYDKLIRSTKPFKTVTAEYSRITERNFQIIKDQDEANDHLLDRIRALSATVDSKQGEIETLQKRFLNIPDAKKHMEVVSECERLKFVNAELNDEIRTFRQEIFDLKNPGILVPKKPNVKDVVVLETLAPVKKTTKTKAKKSPKLARGTPRKRSR